MPELTPIVEIRARLRALRLLIIGLNERRLQDLDTLLSVAESEAERHQNDIEGKSAHMRNEPR
jgi:hypothetical protein